MLKTELMHSLVQDGRLLAAFESVIAPMLKRMEESRIEAIRMKVRAGKQDFIVECTELALLRDIQGEIEMAKKRGTNAATKLEGMNNGIR